ncbi:glycosyltransferase [Glycomyces sp. NPDC046736]|uniref:glycosyltransferase n=1 Tax=Glycomyces sp. NPDC046736 TaxID=3155615 RepID=UPI0033E6D5EA
MRVLLVAYGSRGDVEPMCALGLRLKETGADVMVAAPLDAEFAALLKRAGLLHLPLGEPVRRRVSAAAPVPRDTASLIAASFNTIASVAADCDAMVATGMFPVVAAARSAADALGPRYRHVSFQSTALPSRHHPPLPRPGRALPAGTTDRHVLWGYDAVVMQQLFGTAVNGHRALIGLPPLRNVRDHVFGPSPLLASDAVLDPWRPTDLDAVQTGRWVLPDARPLPPELDAFLAAGPPPVYVGFGSIPMRGADEVARVAVTAARAAGHRVVLARGWADLRPIDDADDCVSVGEVNQQALFSRIAAVVHHGGAGTTAAAARAGTPQVVLPQIADQPHWAARVADLGIGCALTATRVTPRTLTAAIESALDMRTRAEAVAATMTDDGARIAADLLRA